MEIKPPAQLFHGTPFVDKRNILNVSVGVRIRSLRQERGWKLRELSVVSGVPASTISDLEHGRSVNAVGSTLVKLAAAFQVDPTALQTGGPVSKADTEEPEILRIFKLLSATNRDALVATAKALLGSQGGHEGDPATGDRPHKLQ